MMTNCRLAGYDFCFPFSVPDFEPFKTAADTLETILLPGLIPQSLSHNIVGLVGGRQRQMEIRSVPSGFLLKVVGGSDFFVAHDGCSILCVDKINGKLEREGNALNDLDREILLGPALVLALAMQGTWSLHASAVMFREQIIVFLGESGQGKSTLAAYLATAGSPDWCLVTDDILPVTLNKAGVNAWPRFPQLKLPVNAQPGAKLPECLGISKVCVLTSTGQDEIPELHCLSPGQAAQELIGHTAGTRLFESDLLGKHLTFCARAAEQVPVYQLTYPHRKNALPLVKELLESLC